MRQFLTLGAETKSSNSSSFELRMNSVLASPVDCSQKAHDYTARLQDLQMLKHHWQAYQDDEIRKGSQAAARLKLLCCAGRTHLQPNDDAHAIIQGVHRQLGALVHLCAWEHGQ